MRICILTQADSLAWTQHYVDAFRQRAEVITVGPGLTPDEQNGWGVDTVPELLTPNDVEVELTPDLDLRTVLPSGWKPDLLVGISKGGIALRTLPDTIACPSVYLSIDTWQSPGDYVDAQCYDFTFVAQRSFADRLVAAGASKVEWLPLACNPAAHFPTGADPDVDIAFVGSIVLPVHRQRNELFNRLQSSFTSVGETRAFGRKACDIMARGRIAFNHCAVFDLNMRVFEVMAMNRPLLTNRDAERNGLLDLFEDGKHLILYENEDDVVENASYYLEHQAEREAIARAGYEHVVNAHTYQHRVDAILETVAGEVPALRNGRFTTNGRPKDPFGNMIPFAAKRVAVVGLSLDAMLEEIQAQGTTELIHIESDPAQWPKRLDAVVLSDTRLVHANSKAAIRAARNMLVPGGTLIFRLSANDITTGFGLSRFEELEHAINECGLHFNMGTVDERNGEQGIIVRARKRTRKLRNIFDDGFRDLPEMDRSRLTGWIDALGEHY